MPVFKPGPNLTTFEFTTTTLGSEPSLRHFILQYTKKTTTTYVDSSVMRAGFLTLGFIELAKTLI
jgi:hypothetical protein